MFRSLHHSGRRMFAATTALALTAAALILTPLGGSTPAGAATTVDNYPIGDQPVDMALLGDYAFVLTRTGEVSRVDLTQAPGTAAVTDAWASIPYSTETYDGIRASDIELVGTDLYVTSTLWFRANDQREVWVSKIPTGNPAGVVATWTTYTGGSPSYLTSGRTAVADGILYVSLSEYDTSGSPYPREHRVEAVGLAGATAGSWSSTDSDIDEAVDIAVANNTIYLRVPASSWVDVQRLACAAVSGGGTEASPGAIDMSCMTFGTSETNGYYPRTVAFDGSTGYIGFDDEESSWVQQYAMSGSTFTAGDSYGLTRSAKGIVVVDGVIYVVHYESVSKIDPSASPVVSTDIALLPESADAEKIVSHGGKLFTVNTDGPEDPETEDPIYTMSRITITADGDGAGDSSGSGTTACIDPRFVVNLGGQESNALQSYSPTGELVGSVPLAADYGDIALSRDGTTIYGVKSDGSNDDEIDVIDASTGTVTSTITITGVAAGVGGWVGAAILPDDTLVIGTAADATVYIVDPATGSSSVWADMSTADAAISFTAGDFSRLPNGAEIALAGTDGLSTRIVLIADDGTATAVGTIPVEAWGAGRVGNEIFIAGADGVIRALEISDVPTTAGTNELPTRTVATGEIGTLWGAAGSQDAETGTCPETLAMTGADADTAGHLVNLAALLVVAGVGIVLVARRRLVGSAAVAETEA